ncbi:MAG: N-acetylmuramoyl-L-alanine amidase [candidate division WOR-3 bacterium]
MMKIEKLYLNIILSFLFLISATNADTKKIESISLSKIKDTILMVFEVDTATQFTVSRVSNCRLKIEANARSTIEQLKPYGDIQKLVINSAENHSTFDLTFNKPFDYRKQKTVSSVLIKFFPMAIREIKTIVLDPGHGGVDPGAIGKKKLLEKNVNLAIAMILKKKLENYGLKVLMTRTDDRFVALSERTRFANEKKADLFISIHCNASEHNKQACGFETYFLSEAKTDWERAVLARENGALRFEISDTNPLVKNDLDLILADLTQNEFLKESYNLAYEIQTAGINILTNVDRGVRQAGFYVLRGCFMPSVLIECGFISNPTEEKKLANAKYREKIAQAIYTGIINYIKDYEKRNNI